MSTLSKGLKTRDQILAVAIRTLSQHGFAGTSFQMIADKCHMSQSAILYHFSSKEALIEEVIRFIVLKNRTLVTSALSSDLNALERIQLHFRMNLKWALDYPEESQVILLLYYFASFHKRFRGIYQQIIAGAREAIRSYLLAGQREGMFHFEEDSFFLSELLHDALLGGIVNALTTGVSPNKAAPILKKWDTLIRKWTVLQPRSRR